MSIETRAMGLYRFLERVVILVLVALLMLVVMYGTGLMGTEIVGRLWQRLLGQPPGLESAQKFLENFSALRQIFGAFLLLLIGVELMRTIVAYFERSELHVEVVFTVAMIGIARHAIDLDVAHADPLVLVGMGALILALSAGYYFYHRAAGGSSCSRSDSGS